MSNIVLDLLKQELYEDAINECKKLLDADPNNASYWYYLFLADNKNYIYTDFNDIKNELAFNKALDLSNRREKAAYLTEYNLYKDLSILDNFGIIFRYAQLENIDKVIELFNDLNDNDLLLPFEDLEKFYSNLDYLAIVNEGKLAIDLNLIILNLLYIKTNDNNILDILNQLIISSNKYETYLNGYEIINSHFELRIKLLELKDNLNSKLINTESFIDTLFIKAKEALINNNSTRADMLLDEIIEEDNTYGNAYLYKLIISLGYNNEQELYNHDKSISDNIYYKLIIDNCDEEYINKLRLIEEKINENIIPEKEEYEVVENVIEPVDQVEVVEQKVEVRTFKNYIKPHIPEFIIMFLSAFVLLFFDNETHLILGIINLLCYSGLYIASKLTKKVNKASETLIYSSIYITTCYMADFSTYSSFFSFVFIVEILSKTFRYFIPNQTIIKFRSIKFPFDGTFYLISTLLIILTISETSDFSEVVFLLSLIYLLVTNLLYIRSYNILILISFLTYKLVLLSSSNLDFLLKDDVNMYLSLFFLLPFSIYKFITFKINNTISTNDYKKLYITHYIIKTIIILLHIIGFINHLDERDSVFYTSGFLSTMFIISVISEFIFLIIYRFKGIINKFDKSMILGSFLIILICFKNEIAVFYPIALMLVSNIASIICINNKTPKKNNGLFTPIFNIIFSTIVIFVLSSGDFDIISNFTPYCVPLAIVPIIYLFDSCNKKINYNDSFNYLMSLVFLLMFIPMGATTEIINPYLFFESETFMTHVMYDFYPTFMIVLFVLFVLYNVNVLIKIKNNYTNIEENNTFIDETKIKTEKKVIKESQISEESSNENTEKIKINKVNPIINTIYKYVSNMIVLIYLLMSSTAEPMYETISFLTIFFYSLGYICSIFNIVEKPKDLLLYIGIYMFIPNYSRLVNSEPIVWLTIILGFETLILPIIKKFISKKIIDKFNSIKFSFTGLYTIIQGILCIIAISGNGNEGLYVLILAGLYLIFSSLLEVYSKNIFILLGCIVCSNITPNINYQSFAIETSILVLTSIGFILYGLYKIITGWFTYKPSKTKTKIFKVHYYIKFAVILVTILALLNDYNNKDLLDVICILGILIEYVFIFIYKHDASMYRYDKSLLVSLMLTEVTISFIDLEISPLFLILPMVFSLIGNVISYIYYFKNHKIKYTNYSIIRPIYNIIFLLIIIQLSQPGICLIILIGSIIFLVISLKNRTYYNHDYIFLYSLTYIAFSTKEDIIDYLDIVHLETFYLIGYLLFIGIAILNNISRIRFNILINKLNSQESLMD